MGTYSKPLIKGTDKEDLRGVHKVSIGEGVGGGYGKTKTISLFQTN